MKYLVFGDIHGNLPALEKVIKKEKDIEGYINLGDVVNYGPWSNECVDLIESLNNCVSIVGNHEKYFIDLKCNVKNNVVQSFFNHTITSFDRFQIIKKYINNYNIDNLNFTHTLGGDHNYIYNDTKIDLKENTILSHSHQQYIRYVNNFLLINPGSLGQNREYINVAEYIIWDTETGGFQLKNTLFQIDLLINEMKLKKFPKVCIDYYKNKNKY